MKWSANGSIFTVVFKISKNKKHYLMNFQSKNVPNSNVTASVEWVRERHEQGSNAPAPVRSPCHTNNQCNWQIYI